MLTRELLWTGAKLAAVVMALLLFAILVVLLPTSAGAEEPPAPSTVSVWYAAGSSLVRVDANSGQPSGSVPLSSATNPVSGLASHPTDGSVAVLAEGPCLALTVRERRPSRRLCRTLLAWARFLFSPLIPTTEGSG